MSPSKTVIFGLLAVFTLQCYAVEYGPMYNSKGVFGKTIIKVEDEATYKNKGVLREVADKVEDEATYKREGVATEAVDKLNKKIKKVVNGLTERISSFVAAVEKQLEYSPEFIEDYIQNSKRNIAELQKDAEEQGKNVTECVETFDSGMVKVAKDLEDDFHNCTASDIIEETLNQAKTALPRVETSEFFVNIFEGVGLQLTGVIATCTDTLTEHLYRVTICVEQHRSDAIKKGNVIYNVAVDCIRNKV